MMNRTSRGNRLNTHELDRYLEEISQKPIYDKWTQHTLSFQARNGCELSRKILLECNLKLVVHIAKDYQGLADLMELVLAGNEGLCKAIDYYDPDRGCCFGTYASIWIRDAMLNSIEEQKNIIHRSTYKKPTKLPVHITTMTREYPIDNEMERIPEHSVLDTSTRVHHVLNMLPPLMSAYLNMVFGVDTNPLPTREIAKHLGMTAKACYVLRKEAFSSFKSIWVRES